jgi:hypothetical protein
MRGFLIFPPRGPLPANSAHVASEHRSRQLPLGTPGWDEDRNRLCVWDTQVLELQNAPFQITHEDQDLPRDLDNHLLRQAPNTRD